MGLVLIIGTIGTSVITSILRSYNKAHIINEIEQNGNYVLSLMESQIRNAASVSPTSGDVLLLTVTPQDGSPYVFEIGTETTGTGALDSIGVVKKGNEVITNDDLTNGVDVVIDSGTPANASHFSVSVGGNKVKIVLKLQQAPKAPGRIDYQAETTLQTTVVVRGGYE